MRFGFAVLLALASIVPSGARATDLAAFVDDYAKSHDFSGTIVVERDGKRELARSYGDANRAFRVPNAIDTRYRIASITKLFTAVLVLQLRDQGKLALDDTIGAHLPDYRGNGRDRVTIHQLLDHTSGLPNFDTVTDAADGIAHGIPYYQLPHTPAELVAERCSGDLVHEPGTHFDYNNGEYLILGRIIERVTGQSYAEALHARVLVPLGLKDTGVARQADVIPRLASTYFQRDDTATLTNDLPMYPENWDAAGALYSTADDLATFARALFGGKLISAASVRKLATPGLDEYGYGAWTFAMKIAGREHPVIKRPGAIMGAQTQLLHVVDPDFTVIILGNTSRTDTDEFAAAIVRAAIR